MHIHNKLSPSTCTQHHSILPSTFSTLLSTHTHNTQSLHSTLPHTRTTLIPSKHTASTQPFHTHSHNNNPSTHTTNSILSHAHSTTLNPSIHTPLTLNLSTHAHSRQHSTLPSVLMTILNPSTHSQQHTTLLCTASQQPSFLYIHPLNNTTLPTHKISTFHTQLTTLNPSIHMLNHNNFPSIHTQQFLTTTEPFQSRLQCNTSK